MWAGSLHEVRLILGGAAWAFNAEGIHSNGGGDTGGGNIAGGLAVLFSFLVGTGAFVEWVHEEHPRLIPVVVPLGLIVSLVALAIGALIRAAGG